VPRFENPAVAAQQQAHERQQDHQQPEARHDPEAPEHDQRIGPVVLREIFQPLDLAIPGVRQDQAAQVRDLDRIAGDFRVHVRKADQVERGATFLGLPQAFDRGNLRRLVLAGIQAVLVAHQRLHRREHEQQPERHRKHGPDGGIAPALEQVPRPGRRNHQCRDDERRDGHVREPVRK
jgi:hypothetical protein